ncbi:TetR/AcrR family transcriptional regulator [Herbidospora mongoliensis]|uniref:TetR/AcrR family transcriptional regulator n=1 Tax=Herbidospora mongoliensis TaxID=688067 RepID=UPI0008334F6B|nr:TetR family transcriptional regulator [Herbidospora mongoliensis]
MGLRERKKAKTRVALIDAALDLFLEQGYETTTIDQIAAAVDVSPRTFFRYFGSKEEVALAPAADAQDVFLSELHDRPETESPFTALAHAMRGSVALLRDGEPEDKARFLKARLVVEATPTIFAGQMRLMMANEQRILEEVARRRGVDDLRSQFVTATFTSTIRVGFENCTVEQLSDIDEMTKRLEDTFTLVDEMMVPGWDR